MPARWPLGNDVVDWRLTDNRTSAANPRYLERVLAPCERLAAQEPRVFWAYWAAKEACFKTLKKLIPDVMFAHRRFVVRPATVDALAAHSGRALGTVSYGERRVPVAWTWEDGWVHCVSADRPAEVAGAVETVAQCRQRPSFAAASRNGRLHDASAAARALALDLLAERGIEDAHIVRDARGRRPGPPHVVLPGGEPAAVDISLSHDGSFAAAVVQV